MDRKLTFDDKKKPPPVEKIILKKLIGIDIDHGSPTLIVEDTITGEWMGVYVGTGAKIELTDRQFPVVNWNVNGEEEIMKLYEFVKPPPKKNKDHTDDCQCNDCKELNEAKAILSEQSGD